MSDQDSRRSIERVRFDNPIEAKFESQDVDVVDISRDGARIEHDFPLPAGKKVALDFVCDGNSVSLHCHIVRCKLEKRGSHAVYSSGVQFDDDDQESLELFRKFIAEIVERDFEARRAHIRQRD